MTLVETLACVLVLTVGALGILALVLQGMALAARAQAGATGLATAQSILYDPAPLGFTPDSNTATGNTRVVTGYLNGYFVRRARVMVSDLSPLSPPTPSPAGSTWQVCTITAEVFHGADGTHVATLRQRLLERIPEESEVLSP